MNLDSEISLGLPFLAGPSPIEGMDVHSVMACHLAYRLGLISFCGLTVSLSCVC